LRLAGFVRGAVVDNVKYLYLAERACGLLALLGYINALRLLKSK